MSYKFEKEFPIILWFKFLLALFVEILMFYAETISYFKNFFSLQY